MIRMINAFLCTKLPDKVLSNDAGSMFSSPRVIAQAVCELALKIP